MRQALVRHPDFPCEAVAAIEVEAARPAARQLVLEYRLSGMTGKLQLPRPARGRVDGLWKHTCFEAFVQAAAADSYRELNCAPSGQWAAYRFDGYREGMANAAVEPPEVDVARDGPGALVLRARWELDLPPDLAWRVGISAVIEEAGGRLSYWALKHPRGRPDFHDADCFAGELPAPDRP